MNQQGPLGCMHNRTQLANEIHDRWRKHLPLVRYLPLSRCLVGIYLTQAIRRFQNKETANV
jgi:hypothetical protein